MTLLVWSNSVRCPFLLGLVIILCGGSTLDARQLEFPKLCAVLFNSDSDCLTTVFLTEDLICFETRNTTTQTRHDPGLMRLNNKNRKITACQNWSRVTFTVVKGQICVKGTMVVVKRTRSSFPPDKIEDYIHLADGNTHLTVKFFKDPKPREEALNICQAEGASLVKLDSKKKVRLIIREFSNKHDGQDVLIGLSDKYDNDTWYWDDGTRLKSYRNWDIGEPDNVNEKNEMKENCVTFIFRFILNGRWHDLPCQWARRFICEK